MIKHRIENPTGKNACYAGVKLLISREDFIAWFMANDFEGCSVDRREIYKHYEIGNLQILTTKDNIRKDKQKAQQGVCTCYSCKKVKRLEDFVRETRRANGYSTQCKECERKRTKEKNALRNLRRQ